MTARCKKCQEVTEAGKPTTCPKCPSRRVRFTETVYIAAPYSVALTPLGFVIVDEDGRPAHETVFHGRPDARAACVEMNTYADSENS